LLGHLFLGSPSSLLCADAADANDDGALDVTGAVVILSYLFQGGVEIPAPGAVGQECGPDPSGDALANAECVYDACP
jgi:hypothetical protein